MYRTIDASFWTDPKVRDLGINERLLFLYLITNPHTHVSGIYYLPWLIAEHETGLSKKHLNAAADTLSKVGICAFDREKEVVWVKNMFNFQGSGMKNTLSAAYHLAEDIHNSFLISEFLQRYPRVETPFKNRVSNRVSIPYTVLATPDPDPDPDPDLRYLNSDIGAKRARKTSAPLELEITDAMQSWATENGVTVDLKSETEHMLDHFRGKGESRLDWLATWRTWMRNSKKYGGSNGTQSRNGGGDTQSTRSAVSRPYTPKQ